MNDTNPAVQIFLVKLLVGIFVLLARSAQRQRAGDLREPRSGWQRRNLALMRSHPLRWGLRALVLMFVLEFPLGLLASDASGSFIFALVLMPVGALMLWQARKADLKAHYN